MSLRGIRAALFPRTRNRRCTLLLLLLLHYLTLFLRSYYFYLPWKAAEPGFVASDNSSLRSLLFGHGYAAT